MIQMTWFHTRTGRLMTRRFASVGAAMPLVWMIRAVLPDHPIQFNGVAV